MNMSDLFARDPRSVTDAEFKQIVSELRESRKKFILAERSPTSKPAPALSEVRQLNLDVKL
jgi:hypothetical protein